MAKVQDMAKYVRSKNAGPFWTTLEIFCDNEDAYQTMKNSPHLTGEKVAALYHADPAKMKKFDIDSLQVIKYSYPRSKPSGDKYENDMHSGQQYIRLAEVEV